MKDAISYIRVSSEEQADSGLGLEAQRQRIAAYCTMKGLHLAEVFEDAGVSAGKPLASRPAGSGLLAAAKKGKAVVVVAKLDRLFRSVADAANVIADFDKKGIQLVDHAIQDGFQETRLGWRTVIRDGPAFRKGKRRRLFNEKAAANFPIQGGGADVTRTACCLIAESGIDLLAAIHDAVLIEADEDRIDEVATQAERLMVQASQEVLGPEYVLRVKRHSIRYPERVLEAKGEKMWKWLEERLGVSGKNLCVQCCHLALGWELPCRPISITWNHTLAEAPCCWPRARKACRKWRTIWTAT